MKPFALHDSDASANFIDRLKSHVVSSFDHLDQTYAMVPLITLLVSCYTDTSLNGITWPKKLCCILFQSSEPIDCMVILTVMPLPLPTVSNE